jgi:hypothetical protein
MHPAALRGIGDWHAGISPAPEQPLLSGYLTFHRRNRMIVSSQRYRVTENSQTSSRPLFSLNIDEQVADYGNPERSDRDKLVLEILESTRRIRQRTYNREILAILDEIARLARSIQEKKVGAKWR